MQSTPDITQAMAWVADEVYPCTTKDAFGRIALYFARHGHLNRSDGLRYADRHLIPPAVNLALRTVYESLTDMVNMGLLVEYEDSGAHVYWLNLHWIPAQKRGVP
jgi:hypothetical protein